MGSRLLWAFPDWETMHAAQTHGDLPAWLVASFAITNVTQGLLGFWVVDQLIAHGRTYLAWLQPLVGYFGMFFILAFGWDGKGYQRFFSPDHADFVAWSGDWTAWLTSDVALTLLGMGVILMPVLFGLIAHFQDPRRPARVIALTLAQALGLGLGLAVASTLLINTLGLLGLVLAVGLIAAILTPPWAPARRLFALNRLEEPVAA